MALQPRVGLGLRYNTPPSLLIPCSVSLFVYSHLSQVRRHVIQVAFILLILIYQRIAVTKVVCISKICYRVSFHNPKGSVTPASKVFVSAVLLLLIVGVCAKNTVSVINHS
jgi:hypothetical protein